MLARLRDVTKGPIVLRGDRYGAFILERLLNRLADVGLREAPELYAPVGVVPLDRALGIVLVGPAVETVQELHGPVLDHILDDRRVAVELCVLARGLVQE